MPQDLPGFYYDAEKNRYFPIKGPIPGSSRKSSSSATAQKPVSKGSQVNNTCRRMGIKPPKLLQFRELYGNVISSSKGKLNFQEEYRKILVSQPLIWKYHVSERIGDGALEHIHVVINMPAGQSGIDILLAGSVNGSLCLYEVEKVRHQSNYAVEYVPDRVWPNVGKEVGCIKLPGYLQRRAGAAIHMPSSVSCIKMFGKHSPRTGNDASSVQRVLITTLGSETSGGSVYSLNLREPIDYIPSHPMIRSRLSEITSFNCTVWTADGNSDGSRAVIGTNLGAALLNMETGRASWVCRCKSDVLSLQLDHSGNIVLCGLRNGAIVTVDARQKPEGSARLTRHRIPYPSRDTSKPPSKTVRNFAKQWFELKGNIYHSGTVYMPSSISSLVSLQLYDQYFLASSMDGSIKLYDHRLTRRGSVQSYEGNVNSHTRTQLGVDPSERFVISGGEDCNLRLWSIKSGELLFEEKFMNSVPSSVSWQRTGGLPGVRNERLDYREYGQNDSCGVWLGSQKGIFYMHWS